MTKICLNMIVKQEAQTITQCLDSVAPYISTWCIVDTGSTDGTQQIITDYFANKGIPGELHERPWQDFGTNRTEAIDLALAMPHEKEYILVIDADDTLQVPDKKVFNKLVLDSYKIEIHLSSIKYFRTQLFRAQPGWRYRGVLHEFIQGPEGSTEGVLPGVTMLARTSSVKREGYLVPEDKYLRDAQVFEDALAKMTLEEDPDLYRRYWFYLAQSYRDGKNWKEALRCYTKRFSLGGWDQEQWYCLYVCAKILANEGAPEDTVIGMYLKAWEFRPTRLEAPYNLVRYLLERKRPLLAYTIARTAVEAPACNDILFLETETWTWRMANEWNVCCWLVGDVEGAFRSCRNLVDSPAFRTIPKEAQDAINSNMTLYRKKWNEIKGNVRAKK